MSYELELIESIMISVGRQLEALIAFLLYIGMICASSNVLSPILRLSNFVVQNS